MIRRVKLIMLALIKNDKSSKSNIRTYYKMYQNTKIKKKVLHLELTEKIINLITYNLTKSP
jgi:hypothetical protein